MKSKKGGFYSPKAAITINKALSRISSVNEFKKLKQQLAIERKSTENSNMGASARKQLTSKLGSTQKEKKFEE
eukprot:CAMPEP_0202976508 /NCGR_PEP_ID=MMETSP1396-20130829/78099_1 /ASSEMBLY_ACC=CAM_ASM_000872 /TAXON_ID= /ORGANISM="Pseudokeronopsis sp., Strain Brazil" /LENGTH=72 /DNA_ID=CAMNT_0049713947 /DNA_START=22 /DNA_END=237 /DNA_ORIENTATION=+